MTLITTTKEKRFNFTRCVIRLFFSLFFVVFVINQSLASDKYQTTNDTSLVDIETPIKKVSLLVGVNLTHNTINEISKKMSGASANLLNPGGEILLSYQAKPNWKTYIGANYQYGKISTNSYYGGERIQFHEVSFPFITDLPSFNVFKTKFLPTTGLYLGAYVKIKAESKGRGENTTDGNEEWREMPIYYKDDRFICDYYIGVQNQDLNKLSPLRLAFFIKYQLHTNYLNWPLAKFKFGIQIQLKP